MTAVLLPILLHIFVFQMASGWIHKPVIFFGKRINFLFAAVLSVPVWLATNNYVDNLPVSEDEAVSTGITMCFFAGIFAGRYLAEVWKPHTRFAPRKLVISLAIIVVTCLCWIFIHADNPFGGRGLNMLLFILPFLVMSLATGVLIKTLRSLAEQELVEAKTSAARSESELRLLQSQLSPHFLFNTLNNLYGLSLTQYEKIPPLLLRLSDLLRYSVYEANETFVPLKDELGYINNYIEFEKIRLGERLALKMDIDVPPGDTTKIAPMLLIVFIENAFKHSKNTYDKKVFVDISLKKWNGLVLFSVKNSYNREEKTFDKSSGFGLNNVCKRLELMYPGTHKLDIEDGNGTYSVMLHVKTKD